MPPAAHLKPDRLDVDPSETDSDKKFSHWLRTFHNYVQTLDEGADKLATLVNFIGHQAYSLIENENTYENAVAVLKASYTKTVNPIFARHVLATRKQQPDETLDDYLRNLKLFAKNCQFTPVTAAVYHDESVRDSFISGLRSTYIRQRLLENNALTLDQAFTSARSLEVAMKNSETYSSVSPTCAVANYRPIDARTRPPPEPDLEEPVVAATRFNRNPQSKCYFCGYTYHPRYKCPAKDVSCSKCQKKRGIMRKFAGETPHPLLIRWLLPLILHYALTTLHSRLTLCLRSVSRTRGHPFCGLSVPL